jgi:CO/xanthine dehydrogenase Mo-binding subunit
MTTANNTAIVGAGIDRVDGPPKVTGAARYPLDFTYPDLVHAAPVRSTIAAGRIKRIDTSNAAASPGVRAVITYRNVPRLSPGPMSTLGPSPAPPLQDDRILHYGQYVAVVVADTSQQATAAARLVDVDYERADPVLDFDDPRSEVRLDPWGFDVQRGDVDAGIASAGVVHEATYTTPDNTNNPLGLFATVAAWDGNTVTVHDTTQWTSNARATIAAVFNLPETSVRVLAPYVGGGFGSGLRVWPHVILAVLASRVVGRPVKVVLTRPEMFTGVGHRPSTVQRIKIGATRDGDLLAVEHESTQSLAMEDENTEPVTAASTAGYAVPNVSTHDRQKRLNIPPPGSMRAPGEAQGNFALESAIDELSYQLGMDPLDLRLRNYTDVEPASGLPWSSKALRECYTVGAQRFGWSRRNPKVGSMRDGDWQVGYGLAGVSYFWWQVPCNARATISRDGSAFVRSAATDIGTGTYTVMRQLSAEMLGIGIDRVRFDLGDSDMPYSPQAGGSGLTGALGNAVYAASQALIARFLDTVAGDAGSPLRGFTVNDVAVTDGRIHRKADPSASESYAGILDRHGMAELTADGVSTPPTREQTGMAPAGAFAAKFVEVRVDVDLGLLRVSRVVSVIDGGRILNAKLARSQIIGGTVGGIGQAMFEETVTDSGTGRIANATFGDYLVAVNADVPELDVVFVGETDKLTPIGTKGIGEIGICGIAAAIANGVYHATGKRIRSLPISLDKILNESHA